MASPNIKNVPANLISDWITTLLVVDNSDQSNFTNLIQMTDSDKITSLTSYLNSRISSDNSQISGLAAASQASQNALNADISACQAAITSMGG